MFYIKDPDGVEANKLLANTNISISECTLSPVVCDNISWHLVGISTCDDDARLDNNPTGARVSSTTSIITMSAGDGYEC